MDQLRQGLQSRRWHGDMKVSHAFFVGLNECTAHDVLIIKIISLKGQFEVSDMS